MRQEHKSGLWMWFAAAFLAVALLPALDFMPIIKNYPGYVFLGALSLAALCAVQGIRALISEDAPGIGLRKMIGFWGMIVCAIGFLGFSAAYFWPISPLHQGNSDNLVSRSPLIESSSLTGPGRPQVAAPVEPPAIQRSPGAVGLLPKGFYKPADKEIHDQEIRKAL